MPSSIGGSSPLSSSGPSVISNSTLFSLLIQVNALHRGHTKGMIKESSHVKSSCVDECSQVGQKTNKILPYV